MNLIIKNAIENKQMLELRYNDKVRVIEPHCYGADDSGSEKLRCYQPGVNSAIYEKKNWRMLNVAEIQSLSITTARFLAARPDYKREDSQISRPFARL